MAVNKVILIGNLGQNPELRYTNNQTAVATLRIATSDRRKDASGNWVEHTEWHSVVVFGKTAENCAQYLTKGRQVYVEGKLQTRKWQDKEGKDRYSTEVLGNTVQFIGGGGKGSGITQQVTQESSGEGSSVLSSLESADAVAANTATQGPSFSDDDIPF